MSRYRLRKFLKAYGLTSSYQRESSNYAVFATPSVYREIYPSEGLQFDAEIVVAQYRITEPEPSEPISIWRAYAVYKELLNFMEVSLEDIPLYLVSDYKPEHLGITDCYLLNALVVYIARKRLENKR